MWLDILTSVGENILEQFLLLALDMTIKTGKDEKSRKRFSPQCTDSRYVER